MRPAAPRAAIAALALSAGVALLLACAARGSVSLPLLRLPPPSGRFPVGTRTLRAVGPAALPVTVWYPAQKQAAGTPAAYLTGPVRASAHRRFVAALVRTDARSDAPLAEGTFPVLVYLAGWGGTRFDNTALAQSLASHGYIVVALDDPYPDPGMDFSTAAAYGRTVDWADRKVRQSARLALRTLDALAKTNDPLGRRVAGGLGHLPVGAYGFSFGGAVAAEAASLDPRIHAVVDLDGWIFGEPASSGVAVPFLVLNSAPPTDTSPGAAGYAGVFDRLDDRDIRLGMRRLGGAMLTIAGTDHNNFTDAGALPSLRRTGLGPIDGARAARIIDRAVLAFFDRAQASGPRKTASACNQPEYSKTIGGLDPAVTLEAWGAPCRELTARAR